MLQMRASQYTTKPKPRAVLTCRIVARAACFHLFCLFGIAAGLLAQVPAKPANTADLQKQGLELADKGHYSEAVAMFRRALERAPNDPEILNDLGIALRKQGDTAASLTALENAIHVRPGDARILSNLALTLR